MEQMEQTSKKASKQTNKQKEENQLMDSMHENLQK